MKSIFKQNIFKIAIFVSLAYSQISFAEKMDIETQSILINKLQSVLDISVESVSKQNMIIRLADLYSERARQYAIQNEGRGDQDFRKEITSDRNKAIELYSQALKNADTETQSRLYLQMAHLYNMQGQQKKSKDLFEKIISNKKKYDPFIVSQAHIEAGDHEFNNQNFKKAQSHYESALKNKNSPRKNYANYRIAWAHFHRGETETAIKKIKMLLENSNNFKKSDGSHDTAFQEEASRDFATFLARRELKANDIATLIEVSPQNVRQANLTYLAGELDRTGKKRSALQVWAIIGTQNKSDEDQLEGQIKIARIQYDLNKKKETVIEIEKAAKMLMDCDNDNSHCATNAQLLRKLITDWGMAEEIKPSAELISAYKVYTNYFPDMEINYWAGIAAQKRQQWIDAFGFYKNSAEIAYSTKNDNKKKTLHSNINKVFEGSLLAAIEVAERANNAELKSQAYAQYLKLNPNGEKSLEVEYQITQLMLGKGEHKKAAERFKEIALTKKQGPQSIKDKAADLALDTLVILKDDQIIEEWATEFSQKIPRRSSEFALIARKSRLNQAANAINNSQSNSELQKQYDKLSKTDLKKASKDERIKFHKHKILIAIKIKNLSAVTASTQMFLREKGLSQKDRNEALAQQSWAYEMQMDFKNAYLTLKKVSPDKKNQSEHVLKLGLLAELAKLNPTPHYERYLKLSNNKAKKQEVAYNLVRLSNRKSHTFNKYKALLTSNSSLYIRAATYAYEEKKSNSLLNSILAQHGALSTVQGQMLARQKGIEEIQSAANNLSKLKISSVNNNQLQKSIKSRINGLNKLEKIAQKAINKKDFTLQFLSLSTLSRENTRLAQNIQALPAPKGLNKTQRAEYRKLINEQVQPYYLKAKEMDAKISELWSTKEDSNFNDVIELSTQPQSPGYKIANDEIRAVSKEAKRMKLSTEKFAKKWHERQKLSQEVSTLQKQVQRNPFDSNYLERLKGVESKLNRGPMVAYLDARLSELKAEGGRN